MATPPPPNRGGAAARWDRLSPSAKRNLVIIGVIAAFLAVAVPLVHEPAKERRSQTVRQEALNDLLTDSDPRKLGLSGISDEMTETRTELQQTRQELDDLRKRMGDSGENAANDVLREELNQLRDQLAELRQAQADGASAPVAPPPGTLWSPDRPPGAQDVAQPNVPQVPTGMAPGGNAPAQINSAPAVIRTVAAGDSTAAAGNPDAPGGASQRGRDGVPREKAKGVYLPSGTMIQGVLLNGLDAPTGQGATGDPIPVLVRVKHAAWLPNRYRMDVVDCHVLAAGFGDLASERAYLRSESISCIRKDGGVIDIPVEMYAVGTDGKSGIRGTLVSKQGAVLGKAILAGFAEGISNAFQPQYGFGGSGSGISSQNLENGVYGGTSSALDRISAYYLKLADQMHPIIEVSGGRPITFVTIKGVELQLSDAR